MIQTGVPGVCDLRIIHSDTGYPPQSIALLLGVVFDACRA